LKVFLLLLFILFSSKLSFALVLGQSYQAEGHLVKAKMLDYIVIIDEKSESELTLKLPKKMWDSGQLKNFEDSNIRFEFALNTKCFLFCIPSEFKVIRRLSPFDHPEIFSRPGQN